VFRETIFFSKNHTKYLSTPTGKILSWVAAQLAASQEGLSSVNNLSNEKNTEVLHVNSRSKDDNLHNLKG
jgi:hypothetical protein